MKRLSKRRIILLVLLAVLLTGLLLPQNFINPVQGANNDSYDKQTFWYYPWGASVVHKGVDIFANEGTPVRAATAGLVIYTGELGLGGNVVVILGPKWRIYYYAHLREFKTQPLRWASKGEQIGTVGTTGNAKGKPPHLHYSIYTLIPYPWRIDSDRQGWKKMFVLNPIDYLREV